MANVNISDLPAASALAGADLLECEQSGTNGKATATQVQTFVLGTTNGTGNLVRTTSATLVTPALGTPSAAVLTNATGLPLTTGVTGTLPVANGGTGVTSSTGSGANALATSPTLVTPILGTPTSGILTNCTGLPVSTGISGLGTGVATQLALAVGAGDVDSVGTAGAVLRSVSTAITIAASDLGKILLHPSSDANARTWTIDSNANLALEVGFLFEIVNDSANNITLAITTDTLVQAGSGTTGSITIPQYGTCFLRKIASTRWYATLVNA